jgi:indolepyruvate ferredoxin oxidoreductase
MKTASLTLDEKYALPAGRIIITGTQALIRLLITQRQRDQAAGLNTAGFLSGYRGSPLGTVDIQAQAAKTHLDAHGIVFRPGVNEDLAMTAVWGTQMVPLFPGALHDGVFGMWYGKGPGVDRSGDAMKHANYAGTTRLGGVLVVTGDDHAAKSSTVPNQSEQALIAASIPVLAPSSVGDILELGLYGWALSRHCGLYVGFKTVEEIIDTTASISTNPDRLRILMPEIDPQLVGMRLHEPALEQERRMYEYRFPALRQFLRINPINRILDRAPAARLGVITAGKSLLDVQQALHDLQLTDIRLLKLGMTWPVDPAIITEFAAGLDEILIVEEKQPLIENQVKTILFDAGERPRVVGKTDEQGRVLLKQTADLSAADVTLALGTRALALMPNEALAARVGQLRERMQIIAGLELGAARTPHFCSGCPHNSSTKVPDGSRAMAGIGCHFMVTWMDRSTDTYSHMGAEGAAWIGQAPFTEERHVFCNLGDGTYHHSGLLAIRAAVAAHSNITYRILFNDAVAMTGGQHIDGPLTVPQITRQLAAEDVGRIVIVTDEVEKYRDVTDLAPNVSVHDRHQLDEVSRQMRDIKGVTAIIYDQTCASEKRRRRKRGTMADPAKRAFINDRVCEGCGDCSQTSNCVSVVPKETPFGRKRAIDQSSCNKDYSCVDGFCPSFVTIHGGGLRKPKIQAATIPADLPEPTWPTHDEAYNILITGIGGTGVITIGALIGMAAHIEGQSVSVVDILGLAQKGGGVVSHIRIGPGAGESLALHLPAGSADLVLGCDLLVAAGHEARPAMQAGRTRAIINMHETITGEFTRNPDASLPMRRLLNDIGRTIGEAHVKALNATALATSLLGDAIAGNLFLLGFAWQNGLIPVGRAAIEQAIRLNGQAIEMNLAAFAWGRAAALDEPAVRRAAAPAVPQAALQAEPASPIARFEQELTLYQNAAYAARFTAFITEAAQAGSPELTDKIAAALYKLMAYKDEYEVARLYSAPAFQDALKAQFAGDYQLRFHLAPPILGKRDKRTGLPIKSEFGPWMMLVFKALAKCRKLRGTRFDPFGRSAERREERLLIDKFEASIRAALAAGDLPRAAALADLPMQIRGYGHVKAKNLRDILLQWDTLDQQTQTTPPLSLAAE